MTIETLFIGQCRICGQSGDGHNFNHWVKDTFTNFDNLHPGDIICSSCLFWFEQRSTDLQARMGKDKPQKMQNYSHFVIDSQWEPVSKGDKPRMREILLSRAFPELAAVAVSGQKHIAFRARRNPTGQAAGWVQFEEQAIWVERPALTALIGQIEELYITFSKTEIETGNYIPHRVLEFGIPRWDALERQIKPQRQTTLFQLALFLAQRSDDGSTTTDNSNNGGDPAQDHLAGSTQRVQKPLPHDDLGSVRQRDPVGGVHVEPGEVRQLDLFAPQRGPGEDGG